MKIELQYESPEVEIIEVEVEQGFACSEGDGEDFGGEVDPLLPWN